MADKELDLSVKKKIEKIKEAFIAVS